MKKILFLSLSLLLVFFYAVPPVSAVPTNVLANIASNVGLPSQYKSFSDILFAGIEVGLAIVFLIAAIFAVISGYRIVTSGGNEEGLEKGKSGLTWAVAGAVVVLLAWIIVRAVFELLNKGKEGVGV